MARIDHRVYVGWDAREEVAYRVCASSIARHATAPLNVVPLNQASLRKKGFYWRAVDPLASTEFTYTRFLVPHLSGYQGWALFCDCDFLFTADVAELFSLADDSYAVMCVHHEHRPKGKTKMDGQAQTVYPRKNWSSLVLWNCAHPANAVVTPRVVNTESGAYLHRFQWLADDLIGELPVTWNWLEGWYKKPKDQTPKAIHFTEGGPWFKDYQEVDYADLWLAERDRAKIAA
jgi:lipopolysaccharide biosynthesis glycosyltransferase